MKKLLVSISICAGLIFYSAGCYYDVEDRLYPKISCDTTNITYSKTIVPVLQNNGCINCHSGTASSGGNIALDTYAAVKVYCNNGRLLGSINQYAGYAAMPLSGNKMNSCDIAKISSWITAGVPNN